MIYCRSVSSPWFPGSAQSPGSRHADEGPDIDQLSSDDDSETEQMILDPEHVGTCCYALCFIERWYSSPGLMIY